VHENGDVTVHVLPCRDDTKSSDSLTNYIYIPTGKTILIVPIIYFSHDSTALVGLGLPCELYRQNSDTPYSVGILWSSDRSVTETSVGQNTSLTRDTSMPPAGFDPAKSASLWPHGHWDIPPNLYMLPNRVIVINSGSKWLKGQVGIMTKIWNE